ncbi:MAG: hypothetical protein HQM00_11985 [Magnetococcales bacterium]|nr:hypothetical protein [Magnetococcales bacterium]
MELVYFTIIGGALYLISERILTRIETARGTRLPYRSLIFFVIIFSLSMVTFSGMRALTEPPPEPAPASDATR